MNRASERRGIAFSADADAHKTKSQRNTLFPWVSDRFVWIRIPGDSLVENLFLLNMKVKERLMKMVSVVC